MGIVGLAQNIKRHIGSIGKIKKDQLLKGLFFRKKPDAISDLRMSKAKSACGSINPTPWPLAKCCKKIDWRSFDFPDPEAPKIAAW
jgi:hypothetical protein